MAQATIDIKARTENDKMHISAQRGDDLIASTIRVGKVSTILEAIEWVIAQKMKTVTIPDIQRRVTFTYHVDVEGGHVDSIDDVQLLPPDDGKAEIENMPGWASWSAQEASDWIGANVVDLESAKIALQSMAKMIVWLRKIGAGE